MTGNIVVIDLLSDDEGVVPLNHVDAAAEMTPDILKHITLDDALREILQVLPDIDPKVPCLLPMLMIVCSGKVCTACTRTEHGGSTVVANFGRTLPSH